MKGLISNITKKIKKSGSSNKDPEAERLQQQLNAEYNKSTRREALKHPKPQAESKVQAVVNPDDAVIYDNVPDSEGGTYHVHEVLKVQLPAAGSRQFDLKLEYLDSGNSKNASIAWAIDSMLIDEEMLYLEDEEADRMYLELKQRSTRRRNMEEKENRLNNAMQAAAEEEEVEEEEKGSKDSKP